MPDQQDNQNQPIYPEPHHGPLSHGSRVIQPLEKDPAVDMIRQKIQSLYAEEPDAKEEIAEVTHSHLPGGGSKHQQFIAGINASGKSMAEIQAAWHNYYIGLPDNEKYEVWQEFYVQNGANPAYQQFNTPSEPIKHIVNPEPAAAPAPIPDATPRPGEGGSAFEIPAVNASQHAVEQPATPVVVETPTEPAEPKPAHKTTHKPTRHAVHHRITSRTRALERAKKLSSNKTEKAAAIKKRIVETVKTAAASDGKGKLTRKHHLQSALFGLGCGAIVLLIFLFSFFNEVIIAPFIQPSRQANDTPVIVDTASANISGGTKVIIPKINLEIPVDYSQNTISESAIELALDNGVVHYPSTTKPGETGNAAFFGHSSNNIFNPGKYKFAFVLLHELAPGDIFYLNYNGTTYAYRVFEKKIVTPKQVDVLLPVDGHAATATLITCDPPGTSINRLIVVGDQISPDPNTNGQPSTDTATTGTDSSSSVASENLPGNGPSLWSRIVNSIF